MKVEVLDKKKSFAPKLRFKGFDGKWKSIIIGDHVISSAFGPRFSSDLYSDSGNVLTLRTTDMDNDGNICYDKLPLAKLNLDELKEHILLKGDLVISRSGTIGVTGVFQGYSTPVIPGAFLIRFRFNKDALLPDFVRLYFNCSKGRNEIESLSAGGVQKNLTGTSVLKMSLVAPDFPEQQKIASFLSAVDEKIQQLTHKKELLEQYKKGVMQQIFSGKLRFKDEDGKAFPKWEEKRLGDFGDTFNGLTGKTKENFGEGKPYIQYMQIFSSSKIDVTKCGLVQIGENENQPRVQYGDVFFTTSSETPNEIGTCSVLLEETKEMYLNSFCFGFRPNSLEQLVPSFASYLFRNEVFRKKIIKLAQGSTRYNMSKVQLLKLRVSLPSNNEQKKIANYLSNIDKKIESVNNQITQTQTFKKGLLQQMFV